MKHALHQLRYLALVTAIVTATPATAERTFRWVDEEGNVHYGDRVPPRYSIHERRLLNEQGRTVKIYEAPKTPEQKAEEKRLADIEAEKKRQREAQARYDRTLMATYASEKDIAVARDDKIDSIGALIKLTESRIGSLEARLVELTADAAEFERSGKPLPGALQRQIKGTREQITQNQEFIAAKNMEKRSIHGQFDAYIRRFRELTSDQPTATATTALTTGSKLQAPLTPVTATQSAKAPPAATATPSRTQPATQAPPAPAIDPREQELLEEREKKIIIVDLEMQEIYIRLDSMHTRLAELSDSADTYQSKNEKLPEDLLGEMKEMLAKITEGEETLEVKRQLKEQIETEYATKLTRHRELR